MKNKIVAGKVRAKKGGYNGNKLWQAHRLEPDVKDFGTKTIKKEKTKN